MIHSHLLLIVLVINLTFSAIGDTLSRMSGVTNNYMWFFFGLAMNIVTVISFMFLVRLGGLSDIVPIVLVLTIVSDVLIGFYIFHEQLEPMQWVGVGIGVLSVMLISNTYKMFL